MATNLPEDDDPQFEQQSDEEVGFNPEGVKTASQQGFSEPSKKGKDKKITFKTTDIDSLKELALIKLGFSKDDHDKEGRRIPAYKRIQIIGTEYGLWKAMIKGISFTQEELEDVTEQLMIDKKDLSAFFEDFAEHVRYRAQDRIFDRDPDSEYPDPSLQKFIAKNFSICS